LEFNITDPLNVSYGSYTQESPLIIGTLIANGSSGKLINFYSHKSGTHAYVNADKTELSYCSFKDIYAGGNAIDWDASNNCTDNGNNINIWWGGHIMIF
jgi:hypothetical protein